MLDTSKENSDASLASIHPGEDFRDAVLAGLSCPQKQLPCRFLYDHTGSKLFEDITRLREYYPTRTEISLLKTHAQAIGAQLPSGAALIEFGSGSSRKTPLLIAGLRNLAAYVPIDISEKFLHQAAAQFSKRLPDIDIMPLTGDFNEIVELPAQIKTLPKIGFFPGSTIGNLPLNEAQAFLERAIKTLGANAWFVIGVDLQKSLDILIPAYDDKDGVTAQFNLNLLARINRELGGNFDLAAFNHEARYNEKYGRIEMHLISQRAQTVTIAGQDFTFKRHESIHTENSHKYTIASFHQLARKARWQPITHWCDEKELFSLHLLRAG